MWFIYLSAVFCIVSILIANEKDFFQKLICLFLLMLCTLVYSNSNNIVLSNEVLLKHNLLQHNSKTGELEPVGKLKEIMEEIK